MSSPRTEQNTRAGDGNLALTTLLGTDRPVLSPLPDRGAAAGTLAWQALDGCPADQQVYLLDNGVLRLGFLPAVGGRLISLVIDARELLWRDPLYFGADLRPLTRRATWPALDGSMASWANIGGSKTWPAPQGWDGPGQWAGPPDPVLDSGQWQVAYVWLPGVAQTAGIHQVTLTSPPDLVSGLRLVREFSVPDGEAWFSQSVSFTNISSRPVRWSIWEVCQVDTEPRWPADRTINGVGTVTVSVSEPSRPINLAQAHGHLAVGSARHGRHRFDIQPVVAKVGFPQANGHLAYSAPDGASLRLDFDVDPTLEYPDQGSRVELWMQLPLTRPLDQFGGLHPTANLIELEVLSPLTDIAPGQTIHNQIIWEVDGPRPTGRPRLDRLKP